MPCRCIACRAEHKADADAASAERASKTVAQPWEVRPARHLCVVTESDRADPEAA
jgi:hypothetical protein